MKERTIYMILSAMISLLMFFSCSLLKGPNDSANLPPKGTFTIELTGYYNESPVYIKYGNAELLDTILTSFYDGVACRLHYIPVEKKKILEVSLKGRKVSYIVPKRFNGYLNIESFFDSLIIRAESQPYATF